MTVNSHVGSMDATNTLISDTLLERENTAIDTLNLDRQNDE